MVHGNCYDAKKNIVVSCQQTTGLVQVSVSDEGKGFDPVDIPDPTTEDHIELEGGRGVFLMKQLSDEVHFLDKGRTVRLMWKIG